MDVVIIITIMIKLAHKPIMHVLVLGLFISSITFITKFPMAPGIGEWWKLNIYHMILYFF